MKKQFVVRALSLVVSTSMAISLLAGCKKEDMVSVSNIENEISTPSVSMETSIPSAEEVKAEEARKAEEEAKQAEEEAKRIEEEARKAEEEAKRAEEEAKKAEELAKAEEELKKAEAEAKKAEEERKKAEEETKKAEAERLKAEAEAKKAEEDRKRAEAEAEAKALEEREAENQKLTATQLTSINMLNYMTVLTQEINNSKGNQLFLEEARTSLYSETNFNAVDTKTQAQITQLVGIIDEYRMVDVKRERLKFIYEQNQAQRLRQALPNPMGLLSMVQSGNLIKTLTSGVYMAVDSALSYKSATNQAELQFIQEGWALDDEEVKILQKNTTNQFNYMCNMVRDYDLPDEYVVRDTDVTLFVEWANKSNLVQKIDWLVANESTYQKFGPYWLELVKDYYDYGEYRKCLDAIGQYESITAKITRKDIDYATVLPMVIVSAKETMSKDDYITTARKYCNAIKDNIKDEDWMLRYYAAQIYLDVYSQSQQTKDLQSAYDLVYYNLTTLIDEQRDLNVAYLEPIQEVKADKDASKRIKKEIKQYNELIKKERETAMPPVSEALYLNCELLFELGGKKEIKTETSDRIEQKLHENNEDLFLTKPLDIKFRKNGTTIQTKDIEISFNGECLVIPVMYVSDKSTISVKIEGHEPKELNDWCIKEVTRPKNSGFGEYTAKYVSEDGKDYKYQAGDTITIVVTPIAESPDEVLKFTYEVVGTKVAWVINSIAFERK